MNANVQFYSQDVFCVNMYKRTQILSVSLLLTLQVQQTVSLPQDPHVQWAGGNHRRLAVNHQQEAGVQDSVLSGWTAVTSWTRNT